MTPKSPVLATSLVLVLSTAAVAQQHRGSYEDQIACTPDVYRLCSQFIPDEDNIVACLTKRKAELSQACKVVFSRPSPANKGGDDEE